MAERIIRRPRQPAIVPLVDACVTEWRIRIRNPGNPQSITCHSLMPVLLNGGPEAIRHAQSASVPLVDACVTEWRPEATVVVSTAKAVPLVDACVTEWRP